LDFEINTAQTHSSPYQTPYKFSGKEKDEESGYSYFGARYNNSEICIWISVDPELKPYESPYIAFLNCPLRYIDPDGRNPGDLFESIDALSNDFAKLYNGRSILKNREFTSSIFVIEKNGKIYYTYNKARKGTKDSGGKRFYPKAKGYIHTHGAYDPKIGDQDVNKDGNENESIDDIMVGVKNEFDVFITVTPSARIKLYDLLEAFKNRDIKSDDDVPSDPNDPHRINNQPPVKVKVKLNKPEVQFKKNQVKIIQK
jgi:RHS repeat-associated protein